MQRSMEINESHSRFMVLESAEDHADSRMERDPTTQTNVRDMRGVLSEVRQQTGWAPRAIEEEKMETDRDNDQGGEHIEAADWSTVRAALEAAFGDLGGSGPHGKRGADIRSKKEKGHLEFVCRDGCLKETKLGELKGIQLPGAFSGRPFGTLWNAWRAASIFIRTDIDTASKIKFWKDGAVCLDEEALKKVLRLAYEKCLEWTEFICVTEEIKKHEKIDDFGFEATYDAALKGLKKELEEEEKAKRAIREGPTAFAAPPCAALLEKDGPQRGVATRVAGNFKQLRDILDEWRAYSIWVIVWPMDLKFSESNICDVVKVCDRHFEGGGRIVTAWPPVVEKSIGAWKKMSEIWQMLDETVAKRAGAGQYFRTASSKIENGRVFCEVGAPESALAFYGTDSTVGCAKILYEYIRKRTLDLLPLPELKKTFQLPRTAAPEGGGMWCDRPRGRPVKRRDLGGHRLV